MKKNTTIHNFYILLNEITNHSPQEHSSEDESIDVENLVADTLSPNFKREMTIKYNIPFELCTFDNIIVYNDGFYHKNIQENIDNITPNITTLSKWILEINRISEIKYSGSFNYTESLLPDTISSGIVYITENAAIIHNYNVYDSYTEETLSDAFTKTIIRITDL